MLYYRRTNELEEVGAWCEGAVAAEELNPPRRPGSGIPLA